MVNRNIYLLKHSVSPNCILEIRISQAVWDKVTHIAAMKNTSYSWVVRYCLFRLIKRRNPFRYICSPVYYRDRRIVKMHHYDIAEKHAKAHLACSNLHRHRLCLYGSDEFYIRSVASSLGCTITHLVRLALEWNLDRLMNSIKDGRSRFHSLSFYWLGIKLFFVVENHTHNEHYSTIHLKRYQKNQYW